MRNVAPTKTNLLKTTAELKFARLGHELLDQKRNILVIELLTLVDQTIEHQERMEKTLAKAYRALEAAILRMGRLRVTHLSGAINISNDIKLRQRKVMGVGLPVAETEFDEKPPFYSPMGTSFWIDVAVGEFQQALQAMGRLAELKISVVRLAQEVRKTIRKVNALEKVAIPDLQETANQIRGRLEENEREMFVLMKMVKRRLEEGGTMDSPIGRIMVYLDGSEQSVTAAQYAICLTQAVQTELIALYVINTRALDDLVKTHIFLQEEEKEYQRDLEADADRYLNHVREMARQKGLAIETISLRGSVNQEVKRIVSERGIDLMVIGELSRTRSRRDEFYNEVERAMRSVPCSVLMVKDEDRVWRLFEG